MTRSHDDKIQAAFNAALARRSALVEEPLGHALELKTIDSAEFGALVKKKGDGFAIHVTTGVSQQLHKLWMDAISDNTISIEAIDPNSDLADDMAELSLTWLILHEIEHIYLRHFQITETPFIAEGHCAAIFGLVERSDDFDLPKLELPTKDKAPARQCLELQADHEAMDIVLNAFQREQWSALHRRAIAVAGVILLIERADRERSVKHSTHPPAATRLFQLLGHLCELWLVPAKIAARARGDARLDPSDFPNEGIIAEFRNAVCVPAFKETQALSNLLGSQSITADLGDVDAFLWDIAIASKADPAIFNNLRTQGARHLMALMPLNGPILEALGHQGLS